jgi:hypothetical protein
MTGVFARAAEQSHVAAAAVREDVVSVHVAEQHVAVGHVVLDGAVVVDSLAASADTNSTLDTVAAAEQLDIFPLCGSAPRARSRSHQVTNTSPAAPPQPMLRLAGELTW